MKKRFSLATVGIIFFVALFLGVQLNNVISGDNIFEGLNKIKDVLSLAEKYYVDDIDTQKLVDAAINGMLSHLDPHSVYIPASELPKINEEFQGSFEGIGVEYDVINDTLIVVAPVAGGPSEALGILAGDKIVRIDDSSSVGIKRGDVPKKLRGPKGTHLPPRGEGSHRFRYHPGQDSPLQRGCLIHGQRRHRVRERQPVCADHAR